MMWSYKVGGEQIQWSPMGFMIDLIVFDHLMIFKVWFLFTYIHIIFRKCAIKYYNNHRWNYLDYTLQNRFMVFSQTKTLENVNSVDSIKNPWIKLMRNWPIKKSQSLPETLLLIADISVPHAASNIQHILHFGFFRCSIRNKLCIL